jgi:hypothetical protein
VVETIVIQVSFLDAAHFSLLAPHLSNLLLEAMVLLLLLLHPVINCDEVLLEDVVFIAKLYVLALQLLDDVLALALGRGAVVVERFVLFLD